MEHKFLSRFLSEQKVHIATIGRPHGVKGLVRLYAVMEDSGLLEELSPVFDDQEKEWRVRWMSQGVAALTDEQGIPLSGRMEAEKLVNKRLYTLRSSLPVAGEEDFYHIDLIGLKARSPEGTLLGKVVFVHDYGAGTSLELDSGALVPFTKLCVPDVDLAKGELVVLLPDEIEVEGDLAGEVQVRA